MVENRLMKRWLGSGVSSGPGRTGTPREPSDTKFGGFTLVELMVVASIMVIAMMGFAKTVMLSTATTDVQREATIAKEAGRRTLEQLQAADFSEVFALYNNDPSDDPDGVGTGPGDQFLVDGLQAVGRVEGDPVGSIIFPTVVGSGGGLMLREDVKLPQLGMPRDLNADGVVDSLDHSADYRLLPVEVHLDWQGRSAPGTLVFKTYLASY